MGLRLLEGARGFTVPHVTPFRCAKYRLPSMSTTRCAAAGSTAAVTAAGTAPAGKHYVVVGAGLAGLATAYYLLRQSSSHTAVHVTVYDAVGIGAGGSGAAAGLLHPFTPTGKLLWRAEDAMEAALELLAAAEAAAQQDTGLPDCIAWRTGMLKAATDIKQSQSLWKLYGAQQQQHQRQLVVQRSTHHNQLLTTAQEVQSILSGAVISAETAQQLVPGLQLPKIAAAVGQQPAQPGLQGGAVSLDDGSDAQQQLRQRRGKQVVANVQAAQQPQPPAGWSTEQAAALHVQGGMTLHPQHYMQALWSACQQVAAARQDGSNAQLVIQQLQSLSDTLAPLSTGSTQQRRGAQHHHAQRRVDGIVVAAGAAVGSLAEIGQQLPLRLCQGYTLDMVPAAAATVDMCGQAHEVPCTPASLGRQRCQQVPPAAAAAAAAAAAVYPADGPSLLGTPYLASQGGQMLVVGATKQWDLTTQQALAELGRFIDPSMLSTHKQQHQGQKQQAQQVQPTQQQQGADEAAEVAAAADELIEGAAAVWPGVRSWTVAGVRTGVRAMQKRSQQGVMPIAGKWMELAVDHKQQQQQQEQGGATSSNNTRVPVWLLVGLGARGLVYHAWLGQLMAGAVLSNNEGHLPAELLSWRQHAGSTGSMSSADHDP